MFGFLLLRSHRNCLSGLCDPHTPCTSTSGPPVARESILEVYCDRAGPELDVFSSSTTCFAAKAPARRQASSLSARKLSARTSTLSPDATSTTMMFIHRMSVLIFCTLPMRRSLAPAARASLRTSSRLPAPSAHVTPPQVKARTLNRLLSARSARRPSAMDRRRASCAAPWSVSSVDVSEKRMSGIAMTSWVGAGAARAGAGFGAGTELRGAAQPPEERPVAAIISWSAPPRHGHIATWSCRPPHRQSVHRRKAIPRRDGSGLADAAVGGAFVRRRPGEREAGDGAGHGVARGGPVHVLSGVIEGELARAFFLV